MLEFLERALQSDSPSRRSNAREWREILGNRSARQTAVMILGWIEPDPGRGTRDGELERILSNCPLAVLADDAIRQQADHAAQAVREQANPSAHS